MNNELAAVTVFALAAVACGSGAPEPAAWRMRHC